MSEWVSLSDAAELEGEEYNAIKMRHFRGTYRSKQELNPNGGKDLVYIDVTSLSPRAQQRYKMREKERERQLRAKKTKASCEAPWYVTVDFSWFMDNYKEKYLKAQALCLLIEKYLIQAKEHHKRKTEFCEEFCAKYTDISSKQFRRYVAKYKEGVRWAEVKESETGHSYDVFRTMALITPPKKGKALKMTDEIKADIQNLWSEQNHLQNNQSTQMLYEDLIDKLSQRGSDYLPGYSTVRRYVGELEKKYQDVAVLVGKGEREFKRIAMLKGKRDMTKVSVLEMVVADGHTFDCFVEIAGDNGKKRAIRPVLVAFLDMRSRACVGWCICEQPNSEVIKQCCIRMMYPKEGSTISGIPKVLLLDNGRDFTSETMTGQNRSKRIFDDVDENEGFYHGIGIETVKRALPYEAWVKGQVERFFGTVIKRFTKRLDSYVGTLTGSKTSDKVQKDIKGMLEKGELYTMEEFSALFETWLYEYHETTHSSLKAEGAKVATPKWVFENEKKYIRGVPPMDYVITLLGKCEIRTVYNYGIELGGKTYQNEELGRYIGQKIKVRWFRHCDFVCCQTMQGEKICNAYELELLHPLAELGDEDLTEHLKKQKRQISRVRKERNMLRTPYVQRGIQLPEMSDEPPKLVTLPKSESYRKQKEKEKASAEMPDFVKAQAEKAFRQIEKLG